MSKQKTRQSAELATLHPPLSEQPSHHTLRHKRRRAQQQQREAAKRRAVRTKRIAIVSITAALIVIAAVSLYSLVSAQANRRSQTEPMVNAAYPPIDGISCDQMENAIFHIHAHLSLFIEGKAVPVPQGIGIASDRSCFYWLHTHQRWGNPYRGSP